MLLAFTSPFILKGQNFGLHLTILLFSLFSNLQMDLHDFSFVYN